MLQALHSEQIEDIHNYTIVQTMNHASQILEALNNSRLGNYLCDVTIHCKGVDFPCHKVVLGSSSSYFQVNTFSRTHTHTHMHVCMHCIT